MARKAYIFELRFQRTEANKKKMNPVLERFQSALKKFCRLLRTVSFCGAWIIIGGFWCLALGFRDYLVSFRDFLLPALTHQKPNLKSLDADSPLVLFFKNLDLALSAYREESLPDLSEAPPPGRFLWDFVWALGFLVVSSLLLLDVSVFFFRFNVYGFLISGINVLLAEAPNIIVLLLLWLALAMVFFIVGYSVGTWIGVRRKKNELESYETALAVVHNLISEREEHLRSLDRSILQRRDENSKLLAENETTKQELERRRSELAKAQAALDKALKRDLELKVQRANTTLGL